MRDSIDWTDETLRSLDELARIAFPNGSGVTANTLKLRARQGKLIVYRPGKAYVSTLANVRAMLDATRVKRSSEPKETPAVPNALGLTEAELAHMRCMRALEKLREQVDEKKRVARLQRTMEKILRKARRTVEGAAA